MKLIDLSVPLNENTPVYPGDPKIKIQKSGILQRDGYQDHYVCLGTHVGTHIDAPSHMIKGGKNLNEFPLEKFVGHGVLIDVEKGFDLDQLKRENIQPNDIVLFYTGMSKFYYDSKYYDNYPSMPLEIADFLVQKKVKMIGVDMCSPDHEPFEVHKILLKEEVLIIENLTNLSTLRGKNFRVYGLPIKLQIDGAPVRVIAEVEWTLL